MIIRGRKIMIFKKSPNDIVLGENWSFDYVRTTP